MSSITAESLRQEWRSEVRVHKAVMLATVHKLQTVPREQWLPQAEAKIAGRRAKSRGAMAKQWMDDWDRLVHGPLDELFEVCLRDDEYGDDMRQMMPFAGLLDEGERMQIALDTWSWT